MLIEHRGKKPVVPESAYVAPSAVLCGAVVLGERARILHGAVLSAEDGEVRIGADVVVMENALVRGRAEHPARIGDAVLIGPHAHVNGASVEDEVFVATGASMFPGAVAGAGSELRINSVLHVNSRLLPGTVVPIGWIATGDPAELFSPTGMPTCGRSNAGWTSPAPSTGSRGARRCATSWPVRPTSTRPTGTIACSTADHSRAT